MAYFNAGKGSKMENTTESFTKETVEDKKAKIEYHNA